MKKFSFRLERVLQYRIKTKEEAQKALVLGLNRLYEAEQNLDSLIQAAEGRVIREGVQLASELYLQGDFLSGLHVRIGEAREVIVNREKEVIALQETYKKAAREAESLQKLRDNQFREYQELLSKEEMKFLDELTVQRHGRRFYSTE